jgi:hypothetical protein
VCSRGGNAAEWDRGSVRAGGCGRSDGFAHRGQDRGGGIRVVRDRCLDFLRAGVDLVLDRGPVDADEVLVVAVHPDPPETRDWEGETGTALRGDPCTGARGTDSPQGVRARLPAEARVPPQSSRAQGANGCSRQVAGPTRVYEVGPGWPFPGTGGLDKARSFTHPKTGSTTVFRFGATGPKPIPIRGV